MLTPIVSERFCLRVEPRFGEFDAGGVLYHGNYFHLYEMIREALLKSGGKPYSEYVAEAKHLVITETHQQFSSPVRYGVPLRIELWATEIKGASFKMHYEIFFEKGVLPIHTAYTKLVFLEAAEGDFRVRPLPVELKALLNRYCER